MTSTSNNFKYHITHLSNSDADIALLKELLRVFAEAFNDPDAYQSNIPSDAYTRNLLSKPHVIALTAQDEEKVVGGLVAYELEKFEQDRREIYIYDLAVLESHRRRGIARSLIEKLKEIAKEKNAYVIYVQADYGDEPAIRLYESLGTKEEVLHFDIEVKISDKLPKNSLL